MLVKYMRFFSRKTTILTLITFSFVASFANIANAQVDGLIMPDPNITTSRDGVSFAAGSFNYSIIDLSVGSGEFPSRLDVTRSYDSGSIYHMSGFGQGWANNLEVRWDESAGVGDSTNVVVNAFGKTYRFYADGFNGRDGSILRNENLGYTLYTKEGYRIRGRKDGGCNCFITDYAVFPSGEFLVYVYEKGYYGGYVWSNGYYQRLRSVTNSRGYRITFNYNPIGFITGVDASRVSCSPSASISCQDGVLVHASYQYSTYYGNDSTLGVPPDLTWNFTVLAAAKNSQGETRNYGYNGVLLSDIIRASDGNAKEFHIGYAGYARCDKSIQARNRVTSVADGSGAVTSYAYTMVDTTASSCHKSVSVTDASGGVTSYVTQQHYQQPLSVTDSLGKNTSFTYKEQNYAGKIYAYALLESITYPEGNRVLITRDNYENIIQIDEYSKNDVNAQITKKASYVGSCSTSNYRICNKPSWVEDARGNRWDYQYDSGHGGLTVALAPADASGKRSVTRLSYDSFYAAPGVDIPNDLVGSDIKLNTIKDECSESNVSGTTVDFTYVCPTASTIRTQNTFAASTSSVRSSYELLSVARDPSGINAVESSGYDAIGNITSVKGPRTDIDDTRYTTYDASRRKVYEIGADPDGAGPLPRQIVHHVYDVDENEIRTEYGTGNAVNGSDFSIVKFDRTAYDANHRVIRKEVVTP